MESIAEGKPLSRAELTLLLASPRGFCAGVERAIRIVELSLAKYGAPVYVRHEIVHNRFVVERLERLGAVFVDELDEAPDGACVIFSAHGVPKSVPAEAKRRKLFYLNATCPLVSKVHVEAERHHARRTPHRADRPCRPSGSRRHAGPVARTARSRWSRPSTMREASCPPIRQQPGLHHPDHALGRRYGRDRRRAAQALSRDRRVRIARTSVTPPPTARTR